MLDTDRQFVVAGGGCDASDRFVEPTLLDFGSDMAAFSAAACMESENFAPLLPMFRYSDPAECLDFINAGEKPLALYVFSTDGSLVERFNDETSSGALTVNDTVMHITNDELPFGGVGHSGMGAYHGRLSFDAFSHRKACLYKTNWLDVPQRYPPYSSTSEMMLGLVQTPRPAWHARAGLAVLAAVGVAMAFKGMQATGTSEVVFGAMAQVLHGMAEVAEGLAALK